MCRFTLYLGPALQLSSLLTDPAHSLIRQSTHSQERAEPLNGDGFGIGWYAPELSREPAVFRSVTPAWNNRNLSNLARVVASSCILAHVRAATQSSGVNEANCHPFRFDRYLCMHNGDIGGFARVRRKLLEGLCDEAFGNVYGSTDSEHFFAVVIDELLTRPELDPARHLAGALRRAIARVTTAVQASGSGAPSFLNVAVSDGNHAVVSRYSDATDEAPESLYYAYGPLGCALEADPDDVPLLVSSERLSEEAEWIEVPPNHMIVASRGRPPRIVPCTLDGAADRAA
jgi:predicted glutamine amidotransferase